MSALQIITPPALEPVSLSEVKAQCRIDGTQDDALLTSLITAARQLAEIYLGRALLTQTLRVLYDRVPTGTALELPRAPLQSITSVKVYDEADAATTLSAAQYMADSASQPGRLVLRPGYGWPSGFRRANGFEVQYVAGYGALASDVPAAIRQSILAHVAYLYSQRGDSQTRDGKTASLLMSVPELALQLYAPYRLLRRVA